jgi:hypothetical protein
MGPRLLEGGRSISQYCQFRPKISEAVFFQFQLHVIILNMPKAQRAHWGEHPDHELYLVEALLKDREVHADQLLNQVAELKCYDAGQI